MENWLTKDGLKAIFKDVVALPSNMTNGWFELSEFKDDIHGAYVGAFATHTIGLTTGTMMIGTFGTGLLTAAVAYMAVPAAFHAFGHTDAEARNIFFPNTTAHAEKIATSKKSSYGEYSL